jgi:hypothetical protein
VNLGEQEVRQGMNGYAANPNVPPPIPMWRELSENSRLAFEAENPVWHPVSKAVNPTAVIGFRASLFLNVIRQIHSARYYNPLTGRFMSRDPEDGKLVVPASLHKYFYAGGDPVNLADPTGRESMLETGSLDEIIGTTPIPAIVEFVGAYVVLPAIEYSTSAAAIVAEYLADARAVLQSSGVMKLYSCILMGMYAGQAIDYIAESDSPPSVKSADTVLISQILRKACGIYFYGTGAF